MQTKLIMFEPPTHQGTHAKLLDFFLKRKANHLCRAGIRKEKDNLIEHLFLTLLRDI